MFKPFLVALGVLATTLSLAQSAPAVRLRGTIEKIDATSLTVKERNGEVITLVRPADMAVTEVVPIALADIKPGSFIGTAAMPQADGTQLALEVLVFPESARGSGEGHYPWDLQPQSTMTNATVADLAAAPATVPGGQKLTLRYKGGEKVVIVPANVPVVTFKPGKEDENVLLQPGARVMVTAQEKDSKPTALRVLVGRNGFAPPM
ncbi:hypothetical protein HHL11_05955 [Ramlibacter sp. G-1-2-2]|uniref:DUF5666 domain-containing protein n=1 Tax=Ramlibacter agri TaxID=2728837 RepID=A0A848GX95_9BURK|nr:hypothetical protein [Ramlibacter agri]NML43286.1 hypothetical protein [Ramlibacter agri]